MTQDESIKKLNYDLMQEAKILEGLDHKNIVRLKGIFENGIKIKRNGQTIQNVCYFITEYLPHGNT